MGRSKTDLLELPDETTVTQYGESGPLGQGFRDCLRLELGENEISMIWGDVDSDAASIMVTRHLTPGRMCRKTLVGILREAGFVVLHTPTTGNRLHVSVFPPQDGQGAYRDWGLDLAKRYNDCFTDWVMGAQR